MFEFEEDVFFASSLSTCVSAATKMKTKTTHHGVELTNILFQLWGQSLLSEEIKPFLCLLFWCTEYHLDLLTDKNIYFPGNQFEDEDSNAQLYLTLIFQETSNWFKIHSFKGSQDSACKWNGLVPSCWSCFLDLDCELWSTSLILPSIQGNF